MVESVIKRAHIAAHAEMQEALRAGQYMFLAGVLTVGGDFNHRVRNTLHSGTPNRMSQYTVPEIFFTGSEAQTKKLQVQYGGSVYFNDRQGAHMWKVQGHEATELAREVKDFVPARLQELDTFLEWEHASKQKRLELVKRLNDIRRLRITESPELQARFLKNPVFLAGVFEAAAIIPQSENKPVSENPQIRFRSRNVGALQDIQKIYGQNSQPADPKGRELLLDGQDAVRVLEIVKPHLAGQVSDYVKTA